jgi:virulence factor Mce-like protein
MLTRLVRIQLAIFVVVSIVGVCVMVLSYMQAPTLLGVGRITVTLELPATGGLYRYANVTYRGVQVGRVLDVHAVRGGAKATLSLATSPRIPAELTAEVRSVSAVGEQYVDLLPRGRSGPYLADGSVITRADTTIPAPVGPMVDKVSALVESIPENRIGDLLDESFEAFNGAAFDTSSLVDSGSKLAGALNSVAGQFSTLVEDSQPLLDSQVESVDALREWTHSLAGVTGQLVDNDPQVRTLLETAPGALNEVTQLLDRVKPTLPVLLANLTTVGQVAVTYRPSLEQLLVILPPLVAYTQASSPDNNPTGIPIGDFRLASGDPPGCTVGFLPPSSWRSPADQTALDAPDGLYCKLPQDSPVLVRGTRNLPCMGVPGKRAPTVQQCYSDRPYEPLAMRQHVLGPYPLDPNLIAQGVPPDSRVNPEENTFGPVEGTPMPPGQPGSGPLLGGQPEPSEGPAPSEHPAPAESGPATTPQPQAPAVAPSAFGGSAANGPSVAIAEYDPRTGRYATPTGEVFAQTDLVSGPPQTWQDLLYRTDPP